MQELIERLRQFRDDRNWSQFHTPKDLAISVSVEAGELLELFQWQPQTAEPGPETTAKIASEAADVLLYLLLLTDRVGVDLMAAAQAKIDLNEKRFPIQSSYGVAKQDDLGETAN
ncbi:nucleotide pyrophosphohydrolase [Ancylobacter sp. WKF20]|uniref:nucleotide pyrophosphohydrolase n=1 Tax=Ancylobacter sp. WKF20 TaxID=3039801 RepID=UPI002434614E|nr:nucleotide pyrophosphohydrolase [Ancylobacter sp. WKF20]WGD29590.1 nucleotide pyrophosphohydrolase [Ancylobacter sp. WKF20]